MLAYFLQLSAEESAWVSLALVAAIVLLLGMAGEYTDTLSAKTGKRVERPPGI